jgi:hypothetical protein
MRVDLSPTKAQNWWLIGMSQAHQSILKLSVLKQSRALGQQPLWTETASWTSKGPSACAQETELRCDVLVISLDNFLANRHSCPPSMLCSNSGRIHLLWDWGPFGRNSLQWATSDGFHGVIHHMASLTKWCTAATRRAPTHFHQSHPLLGKVDWNELAKGLS